MSFLVKLPCLIGWHGPVSLGNTPSYPRNARLEPFVRGCEVCGAVWFGSQIEIARVLRTVGDWQRLDDPSAEAFRIAQEAR